MTPLDVAVALAVAVLILIALYALGRLIGLIDTLIHESNRKEEHEEGLRDVREADDPRS